MSGPIPYLPIGQEPPGRKLGHYKIRRPIAVEQETPELDALVARLTAEIEREILYGTKK